MPIMSLPDRYDDMTPTELVEEFELRYPEKISQLDASYPGIIEAIADEDLSDIDDDDLEDLLDEMRELLSV